MAVASDAGLVLLTIADLRAWRLEHGDVPQAAAPPDGSERVHLTGTATLPTEHGRFSIHGFRDQRTGCRARRARPAGPDGTGGDTPGAGALRVPDG